MGCCHQYFAATDAGDDAFVIDASRMVFGAGCLKEAGAHAKSMGLKRVAVFTDRAVRKLPFFETVTKSLAASGIGFVIYDEVAVEPTDVSFRNASRFAAAPVDTQDLLNLQPEIEGVLDHLEARLCG